MAKYTIFNSDKMSGTEDSSLLVSVRYYDSNDKTAAIENGSVVAIGDFLEGEREVRKATTPKGTEKLNEIVIVAAPEVIYDETVYHGLEEYINEAGKDIRGYRFHSGDGFSLTAEGFDGVPAKGKYVVLGAKTKLVISATATGTVIGKIDDVFTLGKDTYYYVQVSY